MYLKFKDGKSKALTLSYDDGVVQDIRLVEIMNRYGLRGTFNISSGLYPAEDTIREKNRGRMKKSEAVELYVNSGHEVAVHGYTHPDLPLLRPAEIVNEIMEDRKDIEQTYGTIVRGMAYPYGTCNDTVANIAKECGICYSRTVKSTHRFDLPENWLYLNPTCHHNDPESMNLAKKFVETQPRYWGDVWLFYFWGHSYEFDDDCTWGLIEEFAKYTGGKDDIWYATNIEIYDYVTAYNNLVVSADKKRVYNPSVMDIWFSEDKKIYCVRGGKTLNI